MIYRQSPWMLKFYRDFEGTKKNCSAVLINDTWALTAAYCLNDGNSSHPNFLSPSTSWHVERANYTVSVENYTIPEGYAQVNEMVPVNDIALLRLSHAFNYSAFVAPISLPQAMVSTCPRESPIRCYVDYWTDKLPEEARRGGQYKEAVSYISIEGLAGMHAMTSPGDDVRGALRHEEERGGDCRGVIALKL
ncbi:putative serine protease 42 [Ciona intestinalis]